jgi:hypothetical protein
MKESVVSREVIGREHRSSIASHVTRVARLAGRKLPPRLQALAEYYVRPRVRDLWGGPFNGQSCRQQIVRDLLDALPFAAIVETGTFRGSTTEFFLRESALPVYSVELSPRFHYYARRRLRSYSKAHLFLGDSRTYLNALADQRTLPREQVLFYLDAHWYDDLPLAEEISIIGRNWRSFVIMIDDFEVPDDPGYSWADYGPGRRLNLDLLDPLDDLGLSAFFPKARGVDETGMRCGSVILASSSVASTVKALTSVRSLPDR